MRDLSIGQQALVIGAVIIGFAIMFFEATRNARKRSRDSFKIFHERSCEDGECPGCLTDDMMNSQD